MSFGISAATWAMIGAATAVAGVYVQNENMKKANDLQQQAQNQAVESAKKQATAVENQAQVDAANRVKNNKTANAAAALGNQAAGAAGAGGGTLLTGPQGIDPSSLSLSKSTLLGM